MRLLRTFFALLALACFAAIGSGCVAVAVGAGAAGAVAYVRGDLETTYSADLVRTHAATEAALRSFEFEITNSRRDTISAVVTAYSATDRRINVELTPDGNVTKASIRIGAFGDQDLSMQIHEAIQARL